MLDTGEVFRLTLVHYGRRDGAADSPVLMLNTNKSCPGRLQARVAPNYAMDDETLTLNDEKENPV